MRPFAFFFDSNHDSLGHFYGPPCSAAILNILEKQPQVRTRILRGDLLPHLLAYKINSVFTEKTVSGANASIGHSLSADMDLYKLVLCELSDSLKAKWCTVDPVRFPFQMARTTIWTLVFPTLSLDVAENADRELQKFPAYIGATEVDTGNPLQMKLFNLVDGAFFENGTLYFMTTSCGDLTEDQGIAETYGSSNPPSVLDVKTYIGRVPPALVATPISERGAVSEARISGKAQLSHREKIAYALLDTLHGSNGGGDIRFTTDLDIGKPEFVCEQKKLKSYLLNLEHPDGKSKAKFFIESLGISPSDWMYLSDQIRGAMNGAVLYRVGKNNQGITHGAYIQIRGRNGRTAVLQTGWIISPGESARLVTAYPYDEELSDKPPLPLENIAPPHLTGNDKWSDIYQRANRAGLEAANNCMPTPMTLSGYEPIFQGECGFAWITVKDARTGMGRWLKTNNIGHRGYYGGWEVMAHPEPPDGATWDWQSLAPKVAYAEAFVRVLKDNGVVCSMASRLD